jgi:hypothetical protein
VVFANIATSASWNKVGSLSRAPFGFWNYMIKRHLFRLAAAISTLTIPSVDDFSPEAIFGDTFADKF